MPSSVKERASSLGTTGELGTSAYNLARGLRAVYCGSAFLPAFVLEECHAALDDIGFDFVRKCVEAIEEKGRANDQDYSLCFKTIGNTGLETDEERVFRNKGARAVSKLWSNIESAEIDANRARQTAICE
ncbi:unnamed protein product [Gongylonema pulchrum]|uniref:DUF1932 domain-containing protein n=1 Tax=Gongylonema pulchrum TaxID=637853 RepID=A0A183DC02_9BILA|nr:unnamed protein product [Gongylonema pulchrum]